MNSLQISNDLSLIASLIQIGKKYPNEADVIIKTIKRVYKDEKNKQIIPLRDLGGDEAIKQLLIILELNPVNIQQQFLFQIITDRGDSNRIAKSLLNRLKHTKNIDFARELIRAIGLLGLGETLEEFQVAAKPFESTLSGIITWVFLRIGSRHPQKLIKIIDKNPDEPNLLVLEAMSVLRRDEFVSILRQVRDEKENTEIEYNIISYLLRCGDRQTIPRTLTLLEKEIEFDYKLMLIQSLTYIDDSESKDFLYDLFRSKNTSLKEISLKALIGLHEYRIVDFIIKSYKTGQLPATNINMKVIFNNLPYIELLEILEDMITRYSKQWLDDNLNGLFRADNLKSRKWTDKFPCLVNYLTETISSDEWNSLKDFLSKNNVNPSGGFKRIRPLGENKTMGMSTQSIEFYPTLESYINYLKYKFQARITFIIDFMHGIVKHEQKKFFGHLNATTSPMQLFISSLFFQRYFTKNSIEILLNILNRDSIGIGVRLEAKKALLIQLAKFPSALEEFGFKKIDNDDILIVIANMDRNNPKSREIVKNILSETNDKRVKLYSCSFLSNLSVIQNTLEVIYPSITEERDILHANKLIMNYGFVTLLDKVLTHFIGQKPHNIKNDCLKVFEKLNTNGILISLVEALYENKIGITYHHEITKLIEANISMKLLKSLLKCHESNENVLDNSFVLKLLINSKNPELWNEIIELLGKIDMKDSGWQLYGFEKFAPHVDTDRINNMYQDELDNNIRDFLFDFLMNSGRRKYAKNWISMVKEMAISSVPAIGISSEHQKEVVIDFIQNDLDRDQIIDVLKKIHWYQDTSFILRIIDMMNRIDNDDRREEFANYIFNELIHFIDY